MDIHIIEQMNNFVKIDENVWESGWWNLDENNAKELVGGDIYFHKTRDEPSFYGGTVLGYRIQEEGEYVGRIIFKLQYKKNCRNVRTDRTGWNKKIKIIGEKQSAKREKNG
ncbi:MAG: hypothetical protein HPY65_00845 [Syntrophaceae bacterium]|nr:hypothetical protein [Syntrophaceae bacterium]